MEQNTINPTDLTIVDGPEELSAELDVSFEQAMGITELLNDREGFSGKRDTIIRVSDWMAETWEGEHGEASDFLIVRSIEDYSQNAWKVEGAFYMFVKDIDMYLDGESASTFLQTLDHSTDEYPREDGMSWIAKSQTEAIVLVE